MTKKDYILIADVFKAEYEDLKMGGTHCKEWDMLKALLSGIMRVLAQDNPRFDRQRFTDWIYGD